MSKYLSLSGWGVVCGLALVIPVIGFSADDAVQKEAKPEAAAEAKPAAKPTRDELEKEFEKNMSGSVLVGRFTVVGKEADAPKEERYTISKVRKQDDGEWIFVYKYGKSDTQIPIKLQIEWAGDTPVITLTDLTIPGVGTFSSRVLFHRGWYAGTWQHGAVGGHLFGRIEKLPVEKKVDGKKAEGKKADKAESKKE